MSLYKQDSKIQKTKFKYRSIFISDTHLGTKYCHAESLIQFLENTESEYLYLVGDIVDLWAMKKNIHWPKQHTQILKLIQDKANNGTKVIYTPGNHDNAFRVFSGKHIGNIQVNTFIKHSTADDQELLIIHGDQVDPLMHTHVGRWLHYIGDIGYDFILYINRHLGRFRKLLGLKYWSLASFVKNNLKNAMKHISTYENLLTSLAREHNVTGVVCGHIHYPRFHTINEIKYFNTGDWVEHCTALTESDTGQFNLVKWSELAEQLNNIRTIKPIAA